MNICTVRAEVNDLRLLADGGGITSYEYDRIGRITEVNDIYSRVIGYAYNDLYQRTQMDYPMWSFVLDYDYDIRNCYIFIVFIELTMLRI